MVWRKKGESSPSLIFTNSMWLVKSIRLLWKWYYWLYLDVNDSQPYEVSNERENESVAKHATAGFDRFSSCYFGSLYRTWLQSRFSSRSQFSWRRKFSCKSIGLTKVQEGFLHGRFAKDRWGRTFTFQCLPSFSYHHFLATFQCWWIHFCRYFYQVSHSVWKLLKKVSSFYNQKRTFVHVKNKNIWKNSIGEFVWSFLTENSNIWKSSDTKRMAK